MLTLLQGRNIADGVVSVGASSVAEAGIVLRYHDPANYLVGLYTPLLKAIYIHDRVNGDYGPQLGRVTVPEIGPHIRLTAEVSGGRATFAITDGTRAYSTSTVPVGDVKPGPVGLWHYQVGDAQSFDDFVVSEGVKGLSGDPDEQVSLTNPYAAPPLPAPQDWVLIMENEQ